MNAHPSALAQGHCDTNRTNGRPAAPNRRHAAPSAGRPLTSPDGPSEVGDERADDPVAAARALVADL